MMKISAPKAIVIPFAIAGCLFTLRPALSQTHSAAGSSTIFKCQATETSGRYATVAFRGNSQTPPIIYWQQTQSGYTPLQRCQIVSNRLTQAVQANGGKFANLLLTYGRVNSQPVICYVSSRNDSCSSRNLLLTLRPEDQGHEREILQQFGNPYGGGGPILRGGNFVPLGTTLQGYLGADENNGENDLQPSQMAPGSY